MINLYSMGSRHSRVNHTEDSGSAIISADTTMTPYTLCSRGVIFCGPLRAYSSNLNKEKSDGI